MDSTAGNLVVKLIGDNWTTWKFQAQIALKAKSLYSMVTGEYIRTQANAEEWDRKDAKAQEILVVRLDEKPMHHVLSCNSAREMWEKLSSIYEHQSTVSVHLLQQKFFSLEYKNCSVADFISQLEDIRGQLKHLGEELSEKMIITKILMSLPESLKHFVSAWESTPIDKQSLTELTSRLLVEEERAKQCEQVDAYVARGSKNKVKCFSCNKFGHTKQNCRQWKPQNENSRLTCHYCKKPGHVKANCWFKNGNGRNAGGNGHGNERNNREPTNALINILDTKEVEAVALIGESNLSEKDWVLDSGASDHMCFNKNDFTYIDETMDKKVKIGDGSYIEVKGMGKVKLKAWNGQRWLDTELNNVLFVPQLKMNLFSVGKVLDKEMFLKSDKEKCEIIDKNGLIRAMAERKGKLFRMIFKSYEKVESVATLSYSKKSESIIDWHNKMAHMNFDQVRSILKTNNIFFEENEKPFCGGCLVGKQHRLPFDISESRAIRVGELVHADLCGPFETDSLGGARYYLLLKDDFTNYRVLHFINKKSETTEKILNFLNKFKNMTDRQIVTLRTDNGLEFVNQELGRILEKRGIKHEKTCVYTPQQNGRAERENRTLVESARTMLHNSLMDKKFWAEAINTAAFVLNRVGKSSVKNVTPYTLWTNRNFDLNILKNFGAKVSVHIPKEKRRKLDTKNEIGILVGYSDEVKGYRIYFQLRNKVEIHRDVFFIPKNQQFEEKDQNYNERFEKSITLDINNESQSEDEDCLRNHQGNEDNQQAEENILENINHQNRDQNHDLDLEQEIDSASDQASDETNESDHEVQTPRDETDRRGRKIKPPLWLKDYDTRDDTDCFSAVVDNITFEEAMNSDSARLWKNAIENELSVLMKNNTWTEVPWPENKKVIDSKWVLKIKNDGQYKARLVARGFQQKCDDNLYDVYAPVAKVSTFRILVVVANKLNLPIFQMDVQGAFLYGEIKDEVYMYLPNVTKNNKSNTVCKLNKSIYGLKKSPKCWNSRFDTLMLDLGFARSQNDFCLYSKCNNQSKMYVLLYVDDLLIMGTNLNEVNDLKKEFNKNFEMKDLGIVHNYLGIRVSQNLNKGFTELDQSDYLIKVLEKFGMSDCKAVSTPLDVNFDFNIFKNDSGNEKYIKLCRQIIGSLMYAVLGTRPDLSYSVTVLSRFLETANESLYVALKRVLRYIKGTLYLKLRFCTDNDNVLCGYVDSDWGGDITDRKSTTGFLFKIFNCPVLWASKKQQSVSISSTESEYIALSIAVGEACWLRKLLIDFNIDIKCPVTIYEDNQSAISIANNPENSRRLKHLDIKFFFIKEKIEQGLVNISYIKTEDQVADIFTKPVTKVKILKFLNDLCLNN